MFKRKSRIEILMNVLVVIFNSLILIMYLPFFSPSYRLSPSLSLSLALSYSAFLIETEMTGKLILIIIFIFISVIDSNRYILDQARNILIECSILLLFIITRGKRK